jgi:hypothetical protein
VNTLLLAPASARQMPETEHLKLIQGVIERMARSSFLLKGWSVTAASALIGLAAADSDRSFAIIAAALAAVLGLLDAYYLALERAYRGLYNTARTAESSDWSLDASVGLGDVLCAFFSPTVVMIHGVAVAVSIAVVVAGP